jgi:hypothetical protein
MTEYNLNSYKKAKVIVKETTEIIVILKEAHRKLNKYKRYMPIRYVLSELLNAETMLSMFNTKNKEILENKGKVNDS